LLADLHALLTDGDQPWPRVAVLCGLGGAGKTSTAVEYAHRHLTEVTVAWHLAAGDQTGLAAEFGLFAAQLGVRGVADVRDPVRSVHSVLAAHPAGWLLIFDNVPDAGSLRAFLPPAGHGRVLITSQNAHWPATQTLYVPVLDRQVAAAFLVSRTTDPDLGSAVELADELGGLPLALEQAAAFIQATGWTLAGYLDLFRERRSDVLKRGEAAGHPTTVAATLELALSRLERHAPAAGGLLRLLACMAPDPAPLALFLGMETPQGLNGDVAAILGPLFADRLARRDAVAALRRYSLVTPVAEDTVQVHRLVQTVTLDQARGAETAAVDRVPGALAADWRQAATAVIEAAIPADPEDRENWGDFAALLPHARVALTADGLERFANYLGSSGSYVPARDLQQRIVEALQSALGLEHLVVLSARAQLARWTGTAGNWAAARNQYASLLPAVRLIYGPEHAETLLARGNIAYWTGQAGNPAAARDMFAALQPLAERILGPEDLNTLTGSYYLARWTGEAGDAAGARDLLAALMPVRERVFGPAHPDSLRVRHAHAHWTGQAGNPAGARDLFAALMPITVRIGGPQHPDEVHVRGNHARWTGEAGDAEGARDLLAELLSSREQVSGPKHPDTLRVRHELARWTGQAGDPATARNLYAELLPDTERVCGPMHPDTLHVRGNLAHWTGKAGDAATARDLFADLVPVAEQVGGPEHPDVLTACAYLARWTGEAGDPAGARAMFAALLPVRERVSGPNHPDTVHARRSFSYWTEQVAIRPVPPCQHNELEQESHAREGGQGPAAQRDSSLVHHPGNGRHEPVCFLRGNGPAATLTQPQHSGKRLPGIASTAIANRRSASC
jgi:hypothetical protein